MNTASSPSAWTALPASVQRRFVFQNDQASSSSRALVRALDLHAQRTVAIKAYLGQTPANKLRLEREFARLKDLEHRNIVRALEYFPGDEKQVPAFAMEWIEGSSPITWVWQDEERDVRAPLSEIQTLDLVSTGGAARTRTPDFDPLDDLEIHHLSPRASERFEHIAGQLFEVLGYLRTQNLTHGDIKHGNLRIEEGGRLVILDFGGSPLDDDTHEGLQLTPEYAAPELLEGQAPSFASDLYSAAIVLYETATRRQFDEAPRKSHHYRLRELRRSGVEHRLARAIASCLNDAPSERPLAPELQRWFARRRIRPSEHAQNTLIEASHQREVANRLLEKLTRKDSEICLLLGEADSGKTTVATWIANEWVRQPDAYVLWVSSVPHAPRTYDTLRALLTGLGDAYRAIGSEEHLRRWTEVMEEPLIQAIITSRIDDQAAPVGRARIADSDNRNRLLDRFRTLYTDIATSHRLLLVFDDVQWSDADSLNSLYTLLNANQSHVQHLLVVAQPDTDFVESFQESVSSMDGARLHTEHLHALTPSDQTRLLTEIIGDTPTSELATALRDEFGTSPKLLAWVARWLVDEGRLDGPPPSIEAIVGARLRALPPEDRTIVKLLSLADTPLPTRVLNHFTRGNLLETMARLEAAGFVVRASAQTPDDYSIAHRRLRTQIANALSDKKRSELLKRLAAIAEHEMPEAADFVAKLYLQLDDRVRAAECFSRAAAIAVRQTAYLKAVSALRALLSITPVAERAEIHLRLANALERLGENVQAADELLQASRLVDAGASIDLRRRAAELLMIMGEVDRGRRIIEQVLEDLGCEVYNGPGSLIKSWIIGHSAFRRYADKAHVPDLAHEPGAFDVWHVRRIEAYSALAYIIAEVHITEGWYYHMKAAALALEGAPLPLLRRVLGSEIAFVASPGPRMRPHWVTLEAISDDLHSDRYDLTPNERYTHHALHGIAASSMGHMPAAARHFSLSIKIFEEDYLHIQPAGLTTYYMYAAVLFREIRLNEVSALIKQASRHPNLRCLPAFETIFEIWAMAPLAFARGDVARARAFLDDNRGTAMLGKSITLPTAMWHYVSVELALYEGATADFLRGHGRALITLGMSSLPLAHFLGVELLFAISRAILDAKHEPRTSFERFRWHAHYLSATNAIRVMDSSLAQQSLACLRLTEALQQGDDAQALKAFATLERWCRDGSGNRLLIAAKHALHIHKLGPPLDDETNALLREQGVADPERYLRAIIPSRASR